MRRILAVAAVALFACFALGLAGPADAQFGKLKDKVKKKVEQKADQKTDKAIDKAMEGKGEESAEPAAEGEATSATPAPATTGATATSEDVALFTKYDFVPGDKVIFYDDFSSEELGEFPSRWNLDQGVFEIAKQGGRNWIMCTDKGSIGPKIPAGPLPPKYTIEMDFWTKGGTAKGHWFHINWLNAEERIIGELNMQNEHSTRLRLLDNDIAMKDLGAPLAPGVHTMRIMATTRSIKCYIDHERVANVPNVEGWAPVGLRVYMDPWRDEESPNPMLAGTFRYAEGGKTLKEQLDEAGRIVTHGILFDSGSDKIKAESYKTLADIGGLLTETPTLRLSIEGHTDSDGADEANVTLSQTRSDAVKSYLGAMYKVDGARLETKGWGEGKPIDTNETAEGKANNRRVELVKL